MSPDTYTAEEIQLVEQLRELTREEIENAETGVTMKPTPDLLAARVYKKDKSEKQRTASYAVGYNAGASENGRRRTEVASETEDMSMSKRKQKQNRHPLWWNPKRLGQYPHTCAVIVNASLGVNTLEAMEGVQAKLHRMAVNGNVFEIGCPFPGIQGLDEGMRRLDDAIEMLEPQGQLSLL